MTRPTRWTTLALPLFATLLLPFTSCDGSANPRLAPPPLNQATRLLGGATLSVFTDKPTYLQGEPVAITLRLHNHGDVPVAYFFGNTCSPGWLIADSQVRLSARWQSAGPCPTVPLTIELDPGERWTSSWDWDQLDFSGNQVVGDGIGISARLWARSIDFDTPTTGPAIISIE